MGKKILEILIISLLVAGVAGAFFKIMGSLPISVTSTAKQSTFDVTGEGKSVVAPDQAEITLGVRKEASSVKAASEEVDQAMKSLNAELKKLGIEEKEIKTTDYSVYPNYGPNGRADNGYMVNSSVRVVIKDLAVANQVVDLVGRLGLEQSGGLTFSLSDELREKTTKEAREQAINQAKKKAEELSNLAGMKLGRIVNVQEGYVQPPRPYLMTAEVAKDGLGAGTPAQVNPGSSEVSVTVTLSYETR